MFSLILTVLTIALVLLLTIVAIFYGSSSLSSARDDADASRLMNQGEQIVSANVVYRNDNQRYASSMNELVSDGYLRSRVGENWQMDEGFTFVPLEETREEACLVYNRRLGVEGIPACSAEASTRTICCSN